MKQDNQQHNGYNYTRSWFDFSFENPDKVNPNHTALFCWLIELNNRMGWATNFASPATQSMAAIGVSSYNTYKKTFDDLVKFGFVKVIKPSINQYQASIIALSNFDKARNKALDKALARHALKHLQGTGESTCDIIKPLNNEPLNNEGTIVPSEPEKIYSIEQTTSYQKFNNYIDKNAPNVNKMKNPFTLDQHLELMPEYDYQFIKDLLLEMGNYKDLCKKNESANLTFRNWARKRGVIPLSQQKPIPQKPKYYDPLNPSGYSHD